jgi:broad specificity phosphatase PhoE
MSKKISVKAVRAIQEQILSSFPGQPSDYRWLVLVRHGRTDLNEGKRIAGCLSGPYGAELTKKGRKDAQESALEVRVIEEALGGFEHLLQSPLSRAVETAQLVTGQMRSVPTPQQIPDLQERGMGGLCLLPKQQNMLFFQDTEAVPPQEGIISDGKPESFSGFCGRVSNCYQADILPRLHEGNVLLVSHQYTTAALQREMYGWTVQNALIVGEHIPNCAPLLIGLDKNTIQPVMVGICTIKIKV